MDLQDPAVLTTGFTALVACIVTMFRTRFALAADNFNSFFTMRLARLGTLLASPIIYPWLLGGAIARRISRRIDKSQIKLANMKMRKGDDNSSIHGQKRTAEQRLQRPAKQFYQDLKQKLDYADTPFPFVGIYLLGAIPIAAAMCLAWIPDLNMPDLGVTKAMRTAGEFLISLGNK